MERIDRENLIYVGSADRRSAYDYTPSELSQSSGLVVFAHGYKGFKDWGAWHLVAQAFAEAGFDFLKLYFHLMNFVSLRQ